MLRQIEGSRAVAGTLEPFSFLDPDKGLVERELPRARRTRRSRSSSARSSPASAGRTPSPWDTASDAITMKPEET
jgi:hypothetical protein